MNLYESKVKGADPMYLPPVNDSVFQDFTLEPQMIRVRSNNSANLILALHDISAFDARPNDVILTQYDTQSSILVRKAKRIALTKVIFSHRTPCINNRNNNLQVYRDDTQVIVDVNLGQYQPDTPADFMTFLVNTLNLVPGLAGINFSYNLEKNYDDIFQLYSSTSISFTFVPNCDAIREGFWAMGFPDSNPITANPISLNDLRQISRTTLPIGPIGLAYSPFVDFHSRTLTSYSKINSVSTGENSSSLLFRLPLRRWNSSDPNQIKNNYYEVEIENPVWITWNPEQNISTIDIQLTDEAGKPFFYPEFYFFPVSTIPIDKTIRQFNGMDWTLIFNVEI